MLTGFQLETTVNNGALNVEALVQAFAEGWKATKKLDGIVVVHAFAKALPRAASEGELAEIFAKGAPVWGDRGMALALRAALSAGPDHADTLGGIVGALKAKDVEVKSPKSALSIWNEGTRLLREGINDREALEAKLVEFAKPKARVVNAHNKLVALRKQFLEAMGEYFAAYAEADPEGEVAKAGEGAMGVVLDALNRARLPAAKR